MGSVTINGSTSGSVTIAAPAVAGTTTLTLPATTSNVLTSVTSVAAVTGTPSASNYLRGDGTWAAVSASGQLIRAPQILTSGTSYTTPAGCNNILIEIIGAGGGGGSATRSTGGNANGGGGGNGIYAVKFVSVTPGTTYSYAIGSGGAAGSSSSGGAGGTTSITIGATTYSVSGGGAGTLGANTNGTAGSSATATNMDYSIAGIAAGTNFLCNGGTVITPFGANVGGTAYLYFGGSGLYNGISGKGYGSGGGGGSIVSNTATPANGGAGYQGMIRISEYT
jgi:hypothetical protein